MTERIRRGAFDHMDLQWFADDDPKDEPKDEPKDKLTVEELANQLTDTNKALEDYKTSTKSEIAGLNRRNSELEKDKQELEKEKMTAAEKAEFEKDQTRKERLEMKAERERFQKMQIMDELKVPLKYIDNIYSSDGKDVRAAVQEFKDNQDADDLEKRKQWELDKPTPKPPKSGGTTSDEMTYAEMMALPKAEFEALGSAKRNEITDKELGVK